MTNEPEEQEDEDTLIPEYIELTEDEQEAIEWLIDDAQKTIEHCVDVKSVIEKLIAHIEKQNKVIEKSAQAILDAVQKIGG